MAVLNEKARNKHLESLMFLDPNGGVDIQRYDTLKYRQFDKLTDKQRILIEMNQRCQMAQDPRFNCRSL